VHLLPVLDFAGQKLSQQLTKLLSPGSTGTAGDTLESKKAKRPKHDSIVSSNRTSPHRQSSRGGKSTAEVSSTGLRLWREFVDHGVHSSPCAFHRTVRNVLRGNRRAFRHVPRCADRPSLNAANANAEREKY
jgi:hypothetical protein